MAGAIGRVTYFRGVGDEDYMADPAVPMSWRCRRDQACSGALGDIGSHILSVALALIGPVAEVSADQRTVIAERPLPAAGHGLGFNDLKVIEVAQLLDAIAGGAPAYPDFAAAALERVSEAIGRSAQERKWVGVDP